MPSHISDPLKPAAADQEPKSILRIAGTDCTIELVSTASTAFGRTYRNSVSEDERHSLQFGESARLRNDPRNESCFDVLLDPHEAVMISRFWKRTNDSILELSHCASLVHAS